RAESSCLLDAVGSAARRLVAAPLRGEILAGHRENAISPKQRAVIRSPRERLMSARFDEGRETFGPIRKPLKRAHYCFSASFDGHGTLRSVICSANSAPRSPG